MSTREPLWYCHNCHAEMRPLMQNGEPVCASCRGEFIEKMENPEDDPRAFAAQPFDGDGSDVDDDGQAMFDNLMFDLSSFLGSRRPAPSSANAHGGFTVRINNTGDGRTISFGSGSARPDGIPRVSEYNGAGLGGGQRDGSIAGQLMMQYLASLLGNRAGAFENTLGSGRMGDYVFSQEALDEVITQIMESNNNSRPVPAPEDIVGKLPREVLEAGSPTLEKDCAVCKDQFKLDTEDPDEQIVVTLPCKHPFHEGCILPWLKSSGTCPVCRYALIPQPGQQSPPGSSGGGRSQSPPRNDGGGTSGILGSLFGRLSGSSSTHNHTYGGSHNEGRHSHEHSRTGSQRSNEWTSSSWPSGPSRRGSRDSHNSGNSRRNSSGRDRNLPGGWNDVD